MPPPVKKFSLQKFSLQNRRENTRSTAVRVGDERPALSRSVEHTGTHPVPVPEEPHAAQGGMPNIVDGSTPLDSESDSNARGVRARATDTPDLRCAYANSGVPMAVLTPRAGCA